MWVKGSDAATHPQALIGATTVDDAARFFTPARLPRPVPVKNVTLKSIEARRFQDQVQGQKIRIDHNSNISQVQADGDGRMRVDFGYTTSYGALGVIKLEGTLFFEDPKAGEYAKKWAETRNLPNEVAQQVHGAIMSTAVPEAVGLTKTLRMPPPIPLPQVKFGGKGTQAGAESTPHEGPDAA